MAYFKKRHNFCQISLKQTFSLSTLSFKMVIGCSRKNTNIWPAKNLFRIFFRRERSKKYPTFKDLDFMEMYPEGILLQPDIYENLMNSVNRDCRVLESFKIMDYSLLIGIHNLDQVRGSLQSFVVFRISLWALGGKLCQVYKMEMFQILF